MTANAKADPLAALERTLDDETAAVEERFLRADRHTQPAKPRSVVRASFSFPPDDHVLFDILQARYLDIGIHVTRSELVRAGLHALNALPAERLPDAVNQLVKLRPGPPRHRP